MVVGNCVQLGPVLRHGGLPEQIFHALVNAQCFQRFRHFRLKTQNRCSDTELCEYQHKIGYGEIPTVDGVPHSERPAGRIRLPISVFHAYEATPENIAAQRVWAHGDVNSRDPDAPLKSAIITALVARAEEHNNALLDILQGAERTYQSRDITRPARDGGDSVEAMQLSANAAGLADEGSIPPSRLRLKVGHYC